MTKVFITGSTGYVGSRLIQALETSRHQLFCVARRPDYLASRLPQNAVAVQADFSRSELSLDLVEPCSVAFFLMHSLGEGQDFEAMEARVAQNFVATCKRLGVQKIIYLGGLFDDTVVDQSPHMRSRKRVGDILRESGIVVLEFRASVIIGPGSTSFELIRALVERLPVMVTPKWVRVKAQPIFIQDVISYLVQAIDLSVDRSAVIEIGGQDVLSYQGIMDNYARVRGLRRLMIPIPFLTPYLSSLWLGLVTPVYARVGRKLIDSITSESIVRSLDYLDRFDVEPKGCEAAIQASLDLEDTELVVNKWSTAVSSSVSDRDETTVRYYNRIVEVYKRPVLPTVIDPFRSVEEIGGENGWYWNFLWQLRGFIDLLCGGIGLRRGRVHPRQIAVGDALDWWRVEAYEPGKRLLLRAEMRLPGRAWLEFELQDEAGSATLFQTVIYDPLGVWGLLYWYMLLPIHRLLFRGMITSLVPRVD